MRKVVPIGLEQNRVREGRYGSDASYGMAGCFRLIAPKGGILMVMSSGGDNPEVNETGWEHVSVSANKRVPTWEEMCFVKDKFWTEQEMVVQYHPPASEYVNFHPYCLHMWKPTKMSFPMPPSLFVGPKNLRVVGVR